MSKKRDSIPAFFNSGAKKFFELEGDVGIFGGVLGDLGERDVAHAKLVFPFRADQLRDGDRFIFEIRFRQVVHPVTKFRLEDIVCYHCVEKRAFHFHSIILEDDHIIFDILPDFQ